MKKSEHKLVHGPDYTIDIYLDPFNERVRVDDYRGHFGRCLIEALRFAEQLGAEKLIFKARSENLNQLVSAGFALEAVIAKYFAGSDAYFFVKYFKAVRRDSLNWLKEDEIVKNVQKLPSGGPMAIPPAEYAIRKADLSDAPQLADLYMSVFQVYPVPMNSPDYIREVMEGDTVFYIYQYNNQIISAASAEINRTYFNAEITDCATLPEHRQFGLMKLLIAGLEQELSQMGIFCTYSIARSLSFGMNAALHQLGYLYGGRLANNCYIFSSLEDMNVWVKNPK
ncbi:putative beta-lysine N-acetyltransferase [Peribacillus saganii]|uniref:Putative beta-lysine N-acetyltransferase n=1 Tax=Peribacillus saganii TaxID=2303992 RepID=A0A372LK97_9BACI|nr:putative beta-lysine N-acetyltransferase [Peribacillus saganii]RFU66446.1 putative beta-lysine N-acetyltransferase [Peribacillus saganii]